MDEDLDLIDSEFSFDESHDFQSDKKGARVENKIWDGKSTRQRMVVNEMEDHYFHTKKIKKDH